MKIFSLLIFISMLMNPGNEVNAQKDGRQEWDQKKSEKWLKKGDWKNGLKINVHPSVNAREFAWQYHKNRALWDKAFAFLKNTRLDTLSAGKYILEGDDLFVSVSESAIKDFEETRWEAHKKYIDIQYVIQGKETMGVIDISKVSPAGAFDDSKDLGFYTAPEKEATYYEAGQDAFLIFFPADAHRPGIKVQGFNTNKKLVVKIKAD